MLSDLTANPNIWLHISLVGLWLALVLIIAEGLNRLFSVDPEISRKVVHIGTGNVILLAWWLDIPASIGIAAGVLSAAIALISLKVPILPSVNSVGRQSLGTFFYAISIGILIACFWPRQQPHYAALGILVMTWGDGLAATIGQKFGSHKYQIWGSQKSWEGSLTMTLTSFIISTLILLPVYGNTWQIWSISLAVALGATLLEMVSQLGIDNLTVPLGSAAIAFFLHQLS
ncbi:phosphatidate cytidylyltransferase [Arthrospira sp. O9.13F]|nr:phosphatidate cytidylyltransferase [Arthrospira sp. O9.13F]